MFEKEVIYKCLSQNGQDTSVYSLKVVNKPLR